MSEHDPDEDSVLDESLFEGGDGDDEGYGLELDNSQAQEVRQIFFTTLPQYLEPVEQMVAQLFDAEQIDQEIRGALLTTINSIAQAATRIGVEDLTDTLERLHDRLELLEDIPGGQPPELREAIEQDLAVLRTATRGDDDDAAAPEQKAETLFSALKNARDLDASVLERLTAAGLVTVDQVAMARPDEIAAVSGLDLRVVKQVIDLLGVGRAPRKAVSGDGLLDQLHARLHARVDAEAALEEGRAAVLRLRARAGGLRTQLEDRLARRAELDAAVSRAGARLRADLERLSRVRARIAALESRREAALARERRLQPKLQSMRSQVERVMSEAERYRSELNAIATRIEGLSGETRRALLGRARSRASKGGRDPPKLPQLIYL